MASKITALCVLLSVAFVRADYVADLETLIETFSPKCKEISKMGMVHLKPLSRKEVCTKMSTEDQLMKTSLQMGCTEEELDKAKRLVCENTEGFIFELQELFNSFSPICKAVSTGGLKYVKSHNMTKEKFCLTMSTDEDFKQSSLQAGCSEIELDKARNLVCALVYMEDLQKLINTFSAACKKISLMNLGHLKSMSRHDVCEKMETDEQYKKLSLQMGCSEEELEKVKDLVCSAEYIGPLQKLINTFSPKCKQVANEGVVTLFTMKFKKEKVCEQFESNEEARKESMKSGCSKEELDQARDLVCGSGAGIMALSFMTAALSLVSYIWNKFHI